MTHFGPAKDLTALKWTAQYLPTALGFFETLLAAKYPYPSLQQAFVPAKFGGTASPGLQLLPTSLLFTEHCLEHVSPSAAIVDRTQHFCSVLGAKFLSVLLYTSRWTIIINRTRLHSQHVVWCRQ